MQIRYIGHSCIAVEIAGKKILCDPWWNGPAYTGQWFPYPVPRPEPGDSQKLDFLFISHGHEDHLHVPTLKTLSRDVTVVVPKYREPNLRDFLHGLGFARVLEVGHGQRRHLAPGITATVYINKEDSVLVLEGDGRVLVDASDALHACSRHVIDHLIRQIRARHPRIDTLFLGHSGASWFPNCIQITDDVGYDPALRERVFAENFAYIAQALEPRLVVPIGGGFALLDDRHRWINEARWHGEDPCEALRRHGGAHIKSLRLAPGDRLVGDELVRGGTRLLGPEDADAELERLYGLQMSELRQRPEPDAGALQRLLEDLRGNAARRARRVLEPQQRLICRIDVRDVPEISFLVDCTRERATVIRCDRLRLAPMVLSTRLAVLEALATQDYGSESIRIGYGATLQLRKRDLPLRNALLAVLGRHPLPPTRAEAIVAWLRSPWRSFDVWRRELHWLRLTMRMRRGDVKRYNDIFSADPDRWSPLRADPLPPAHPNGHIDRHAATP